MIVKEGLRGREGTMGCFVWLGVGGERWLLPWLPGWLAGWLGESLPGWVVSGWVCLVGCWDVDCMGTGGRLWLVLWAGEIHGDCWLAVLGEGLLGEWVAAAARGANMAGRWSAARCHHGWRDLGHVAVARWLGATGMDGWKEGRIYLTGSKWAST
jgi:hypothetical protein